MEAEDTVMNCKRGYGETTYTGNELETQIELLVEACARLQAEISFKAGIKEVVEIVNGFMVLHSPGMWRRHLEDWGLVGFYEETSKPS